ncbi:MAG: peptide deformylase [Deltaproteobacteria bacterium]|nr:peptide deformylase [Deltaproteobacteria bacterium]
MAILPIRIFPDPVLRSRAVDVQNINGELQQLIDDMAATMYHAPGLGLAANQVGDLRRVIVFDVAQREGSPDPQVILNPYLEAGEGEVIYREGCLSVPDCAEDVRRFGKVCVRGVDREGRPLCLEAEGLLAIVLQHEIDHLNGTLFIDHISRLKRGLYLRRLKKQGAAR